MRSKQKGLISVVLNQGINMKIVHGQPVLSGEDVIALKEKSGESSITDAIAKAVFHYLKCNVAHNNR